MQSLSRHAESLPVFIRQRVINELQKEGFIHAIEFIADNGIAQ
jgi:hypothetical protein